MKLPKTPQEFYSTMVENFGYTPLSQMINRFGNPTTPIIIIERVDFGLSDQEEVNYSQAHLERTVEFNANDANGFSPIEQIAAQVKKAPSNEGYGVTLGRIKTADLVLPLPYVSRAQFLFADVSGEWKLNNLKDGNTIMVGGQVLKKDQPYSLGHDSLISIASNATQIRFLTPRGWVHYKDQAKHKGETIKALQYS